MTARSLNVRPRRNAGILSGVSLAALALGVGASLTPGSAYAQAFGNMVAMQAGQVTLKDGTTSQWTGAGRPTTGVGANGKPLMTIQQTQQKALLDWQTFSLQAGEVLEFQQQQADWIAVNRVHGAGASQINGEIKAKGRVFVLNDNGVLIGKDAVVNTRQLVTGRGVSDVVVDGATTTIVQSGPKSLLEWRGELSQAAGETLKIEQKKNALLNDLSDTKDWILMNRYVGGIAKLDGAIETKGHLYLVAPEGLVVNGKITAQQVVLSQLNMSDAQFDAGMMRNLTPGNARDYPQFSNYFRDGTGVYYDAPLPIDITDPTHFSLTIGQNASVTTGVLGKILAFGTNVANRGLLHAQDGQIIMAAGDYVWLSPFKPNYSTERGDIIYASTGTHTPYPYRNVDIPFYWSPSPGDPARNKPEAQAHYVLYQERRLKALGFKVLNEGEVTSERGRIDLVGFDLRQMGEMGATSTALFKGAINFNAYMRDDPNNGDGYYGPLLGGNGSVTFGRDSFTGILPDLESTDAVSLASYLEASSTSDLRFVGKLTIKARTVDMQRDALVYMPGGNFEAVLDAGEHIFGNRGNGSNQENEDGSRFFMDTGATIDVSGWSDTVVDMESNVVSGRLFISQLRDSPLQRNGPLYRKLVAVDRRYGTPFADWTSFDNLTQIGIDQMIVDGGQVRIDVPNDFIMKSGSVIDVSGGKTTYNAGFLSTTLLRTMDNKVIDIREADPDELYMGLANEYVVNDAKWGQQTTYYIPLISSQVGRYEEGYVEGGAAGLIDILGPDAVLNGTMKGDVVVGKYQRAAPPKGGQLLLNEGGLEEGEYRGNRVLIEAAERVLDDAFAFDDDLSDVFGDFFGKEIKIGEKQGGRRDDNGTLLSQDFFSRSTMGSYYVEQSEQYQGANTTPALPINVVEAGVSLNLRNGASLELAFNDATDFLGSVRTEGGDVNISAIGSLNFAADSVIDTRGGWTSDRERLTTVSTDTVPRVDGGGVIIQVIQRKTDNNPNAGLFRDGLLMPDGMKIDTSGGGWVSRDGVLKAGKGGNIAIAAGVPLAASASLDLSASLTALGLGGAGGYSLSLLNDDIIIGETPAVSGHRYYQIDPSFFTGAAVSSISLTGRSITIADGVTVDAVPLTTVLKSSYQGLSPLYAATGTPMSDLVELRRLAPQDRSSALRKGMNLTFNAQADITMSSDGFRLGEGAVLRTQDGGAINISGQTALIEGSIFAPAGAINLTGSIRIGSDAVLSAKGVAQTLARKMGQNGVELLDGVALAGGAILLNGSGGTVAIEEGAVLDVSGASGEFDLPSHMDRTGAVVRVRKTVSSAGGSIAISAATLDIDKATYHADAGGPSSRGGSFDLTYAPRAVTPVTGTTVTQAVTAVTNLRSNLFYKTGVRVPTTANLYDLDLSLIDWNRRYPNSGITFPPGYKLQSAQWLTNYLNTYEQAALGNPQVLLIGTNLAPEVGQELPNVAAFDPMLRLLINRASASYQVKSPATQPNEIARFSPEKLADGGFSSVKLTSNAGIRFAGPVTIGARRADGSALFDNITLTTGTLIAGAGTSVNLTASNILLTFAGGGASVNLARLEGQGLPKTSPTSAITLDATSSLIFDGMTFYGFKDVNLQSGGDIAGHGRIYTPGRLTLKADQVYAMASRIGQGSQVVGPTATFEAGDTLTVLPPFEGKLKPAPFEAAGTLELLAPRIVQGGVLRSPLGAINLTAINDGTPGAGTITLLPGSLISGGAEGRLIPWGTTSNGDTWRAPNGQEMTTLPEKSIRFTADNLDLQTGAVIDVSGGGDLYAWEFVSGVGGTYDWLTGYRDANYNWVVDASEVYAVVPSYDASLGTDVADVGAKVYLSGGSGLPAGYYTLLPARYALLPGAFRVTAKHGLGNYNDMVLGTRTALNDGSTVQAGYRLEAGTPYADQRTTGFYVMPGSTLRTRSQYVETLANSFFESEAFLKKALRSNLQLGSPPRAPKDGGSVVLSATKGLNLGATLKSAGATGGRGGFADINAPKIAIVSAGETSGGSYGADYLLLDAAKLSSFGADSLLIGGLRRQGASGIEIDVNATDVVVSNQGSVLYGTEIILAAGDRVLIEDGAAIEVRGKIGGSSGDLTLLPYTDTLIDTKGTAQTTDDVTINAALDKGALVRLSSDSLVNILRDPAAVTAMETLLATPGGLAALNVQRAALGAPPITAGPGVVVEGAAKLTGAQSLVLDATRDLALAGSAVLDTKELSASSSLITIGDVSGVTRGLTFGQGSLGALGAIKTLLLKSYSSIDFVGPVDMKASGVLSLDARTIRSRDGAVADKVTISADEVRLANTGGAVATLANGAASLSLKGRNIILGSGDIALSGFGDIAIEASERVIGRGFGAVRTPGDVSVRTASLTAESGAQLGLDALGALRITGLTATGALPAFSTLGATLNLTGASVVHDGKIKLTSGTVTLRARDGDVRLGSAAVIDVTGDVATLFDRKTAADAGVVNLIADRGGVTTDTGSLIDVSGASDGSNAGALRVSALSAVVNLNGAIRGSAQTGFRGGSFELSSKSITDFAALGAKLNEAGFSHSRRFRVADGDLTVAGETRVQNFSATADNGSILVTGAIRTPGEAGGTVYLAAARDVTLANGGQLVAKANTAGKSGGQVVLETAGRDGGAIALKAGSLIDVSGQGQGGRTVRLRAPQVGADVAISEASGSIIGARSVLAEAYRVYENVPVIDQVVITRVTNDANAFMAGAGAIRTRLGGMQVAPGIELRSSGDMALTTAWNLNSMRYDGAAGVLTLRAAGNLRIDANLSDGFTTATRDGDLTNGASWTFALIGGADVDSANSTSVKPEGTLAAGKGSVIIGGTPDKTDYFMRANGTDTVLYRKDPSTGLFVRSCSTNCTGNPWDRFVELTWNAALNTYIDPITNQPIARNPATGGFVETAEYSRRELPLVFNNAGGFNPISVPGNPAGIQVDMSDGWFVRTGTGGITVAAGRDVVFEQKASSLYTAGEQSGPVVGFDAPTGQISTGTTFVPFTAYYPENGGDVTIRAQRDIIGGGSDQFPNAWLWRLGLAAGAGGTFSPGTASRRPYEQSTWFVKYSAYKAGIGALGGGNVRLEAGGDVKDASVNIASTGRVAGNRFVGDMPARLVTTGGGDLTVDAGGDILSGVYYVGDGSADLTAGGIFGTGRKITALFPRHLGGLFGSGNQSEPYSSQDIYPLLFTSSAQFRLRSGGDLNIEAVLDPLSGTPGLDNGYKPITFLSSSPNSQGGERPGFGWFQSYQPDASVSLFSAGGDVVFWNNSVIVSAKNTLGALNAANPAPIVLGKGETGAYYGGGNQVGSIGGVTVQHYLWPSLVTAVAAAGDIVVRGGFTMFPSATGNLELLARDNVYLDLVFNTDAPRPATIADQIAANWLTGSTSLFMSQADPALVPNPLRPILSNYNSWQPTIYTTAGVSNLGQQIQFSDINYPDLHVGDEEPARIYAATGDIFMNRRGRGTTGTVRLPKPVWMFAGDDIYFPNFGVQHNNPNDLTIYRAGDNIFFSATSILQVAGPGRLEIEAGRDIYIPQQVNGIQTSYIRGFANEYDTVGYTIRTDYKAADIAISTGFNQKPEYAAFEAKYLDPDKTADAPDYVLADLGDGRERSVYLIDQVYDRAGGPDQLYPTETREGLVNFVRRLQGLDPLKGKAEQLAYLDTAWTYFKALPVDRKTPFYREVLFMEQRAAGREANDPNSDRFGSANRGYDVIATLFPGAQKASSEALISGESRWLGDFETYASVVKSNGGGDVSFVIPGGGFKLANSLYAPPLNNPDFDPRTAGVLTLEGGEINLFAHDSVTLNESRILTAKGGNVLIWSSYGDIAAGRGAKTSISPPSYSFRLEQTGTARREPGGLPSGAGIGTLATVPGTPPADVDLLAPNGIVDAGDAGIRVSGNFNVFAVQILGADNIEVAGVSTGLPQPPAQPPTALDVGDAAAKAADVADALNDSVRQARANAAVVTPSIIEVRVVSTTAEEEEKEKEERERRKSASNAPQAVSEMKTDVANRTVVVETYNFNLPPQRLDDALRAVSRQTGASLVYDASTFGARLSRRLQGRMTADQALRLLLTGAGVAIEKTGPKTILLRKIASIQ